MPTIQAIASGFVGSATLTLIHQTARQFVPHAPRMDVIGMRGLARGLRKLDQEPPPRDVLYNLALAGDLFGNALYYSLVGSEKGAGAWRRGALLGVAAGLGAVLLPVPLGLGRQPGAKFPQTQIMTVAWYTAGGLAAAATGQVLA